MNKAQLIQILKYWQEKKEWWRQMYLHAAWVDNGRGGCSDKILEMKLAESKIDLLEQLISECKF